MICQPCAKGKTENAPQVSSSAKVRVANKLFYCNLVMVKAPTGVDEKASKPVWQLIVNTGASMKLSMFHKKKKKKSSSDSWIDTLNA